LDNCKDKGKKIRKNSRIDILIKQHLGIAAPQMFSVAFKRDTDPELPEDQNIKLVVDGKIRQDAEGAWWFRKIEVKTWQKLE